MQLWKHPIALAVLLVLGAGAASSPIRMWRADAWLAAGEPDRAVLGYDAVATSCPCPGLRHRALMRAASVYAVDLADPRAARERLERRLAAGVDDILRAELYGRMAELFVDEGRIADGAAAWERAYDASPAGPKAPLSLIRSAELYAEAGRYERSRVLWKRLGDRFHQQAARSAIGRAELSLREGDAEEALALFEEAEELAPEPMLQAHARLGVATCLERLGNLDEALAAVDLADLPGDVRDRRREGLLNRRAYR